MTKKLFLASLIIVGGMFYAGCSAAQQPLYNVQGSQVQSFDGKKLTKVQVEKAILQAGNQRGWVMKKIKDGVISATLYVRNHMALVEINYSATSYNITYKNSQNLNYDGTNIHKNYNSWIRNLDNSIQINLNGL
ncbi:MAG: hypothetical protein LBF13_06405 [Campylobacteraceae bacterium]|jgi:hypothetical protein|nr:hypothetical protein [Campylobacteraceae bacterium]